MNVVRLDLQLARDDEVKRREALDRAGKLVELASYRAREEGDEDKWKWFDLADALAFTGKTDEALDAARQGFLRFEDPHRASAGSATADPLQDILNNTPLPAEVDSAVRALVAAYRAAMG